MPTSIVDLILQLRALNKRVAVLEEQVLALATLVDSKANAPEGAPDVGHVDIPPRAQALKKVGLGTDPPEAEDAP